MKNIIQNSILSIIIFIGLSGLGWYVINLYIASTTKLQIWAFVFLFSYSIALILPYIFSKNFRIFINQHSVFITMISLIVPLMMFSFQIASDTFSSSLGAENGIKQSNDYNYKLVENIEKDLSGFSWAEFDQDAYQKHLEYISRNYSEECTGTYRTVISEINQFNKINRQRQELTIAMIQFINTTQIQEYLKVNSIYAQNQIKFLADIKTNLSFAMTKCQDFKQR